MTIPTLDELTDVWSHGSMEPVVGEATGWRRTILNLLADGKPVAPEQIAADTGLTAEDVRDRLAAAEAIGCEVDDHGRLVGAALTLTPTPHRFRVRGHDLYAWCGFDTLFLPILLGEDAVVSSTCPQSGRDVDLTVSADGSITSAAPASTVVAVVGREITSCCSTTGPQSAVCSQMPFLADPAAAEGWLEGRSGVAAVSLSDATRLARAYAGQSSP